MLYGSLAAVPSALRQTAGLYQFSGGVWVTPRNRIVDGAALLPLDRAATLQGNGTTSPGGSSIATAVEKVGNLVQLTVLSGHALTAGAMRSQVNFTNRLLPYGERLIMSLCVKLPAGWDTAGPDALLVQAKDTPDAHLGETGRNPPVAVYIDGTQFSASTRADPLLISAGNVTPNATMSVAATLNQWQALSVVFELGRGSSGRSEFWLGRTKVGESALPVGYNDLQGLGPNYALYCYDGLGALPQRQALFKGMAIYSGDATINEVCDAWDSHPE